MEIVWNIIAMIVILAGVAIVAGVVNLLMDRRKVYPKAGMMSFRESMDLAELPVITFINNGKKLNFLLDTGATCSSINSVALEGLIFDKIEKNGYRIGIEGNLQEGIGYVTLNMGYKDQNFEDNFQVVDLRQAFKVVRQESGIILHGILGNTFFQKYRYILNFSELVAYPTV